MEFSTSAFAEAEHRGNQASWGILRFACIQHLAYNGMAAYSQFANLTNRLKPLSSQEGEKPLKFWKYARIFDSGYFLELQPKSCKYLKAIQAHLTIKYLPGIGAPLNIVVIKNDKALLSSAKMMADEFIRAYDFLTIHLDTYSPILRVMKRITKEMADDYVKTYDILPVHFQETGPLWRIINGSKIEGGASSYPRILETGGPSNSITVITPPDVGINQTNPAEGENSYEGI